MRIIEKNDGAVNAVAESIRQCSYITPIIVDENHVIIAGHTRYKALMALGESEAECLVCDVLTEEQKKKYRFLDNKTGEKAAWDLMKLEVELEGLDLEDSTFLAWRWIFLSVMQAAVRRKSWPAARRLMLEVFGDEEFKYECEMWFRFN